MTGLDTAAPGRNALVLSGGGIRFGTHAGVIAEMDDWTCGGRRFLDAFPVVVGTSAGALYGALYASRLRPDQIATVVRLFAEPAVGQALFDLNVAGLAAAYLRYDTSYALGVLRGARILTLLETVFSREIHAEISAFDPTKGDIDALRARLIAAWKLRRRRPRNEAYFADQLTFDDCRDLFIVAVNAYTGQKTVFTYRPHVNDWPAEELEDKAMYVASAPYYINPPQQQHLEEAADAASDGQLTLDFRRYENRVYRAYDQTLYGKQLPLALAVRASLSIPLTFEPLRLQRWSPPGKTGAGEDLFIDGGVDDNFSLSVAFDPHLGNARDVFGIALGNFGYRLADAHAAENAFALAQRSVGYVGDAVQDLQKFIRPPEGSGDHRVTVLNALSGIQANINDTNRLADLLSEGADIAKEFWIHLHPGQAYPDRPALLWGEAFPHAPQAVYLSAAARGVDPPKLPQPQVVRFRRAVIADIRVPVRPEWRAVYGVLGIGAIGVAATLWLLFESGSDIVEGRLGRGVERIGGWAVAGLILFAAATIGSRVLAFRLWNRRRH